MDEFKFPQLCLSTPSALSANLIPYNVFLDGLIFSIKKQCKQKKPSKVDVNPPDMINNQNPGTCSSVIL